MGRGGGWFSWVGVGWLDQVRIRLTQLSTELKVEVRKNYVVFSSKSCGTPELTAVTRIQKNWPDYSTCINENIPSIYLSLKADRD